MLRAWQYRRMSKTCNLYHGNSGAWKDILLYLTHWGRVTHRCVGKLTTIGWDNGLSPERRQAIIWTNAGILLIGPLGTNFSEILIECHSISFMKMHMKMSSWKWRPSCLGLNVLNHCGLAMTSGDKDLGQHWSGMGLLPDGTKPSQIAKFMGPTWGPLGSCRPQLGPMNLAIRDYLTWCWLIISNVQRHSSQGNITRDTSAVHH